MREGGPKEKSALCNSEKGANQTHHGGALISDFQPPELWDTLKLWANWEKGELADEGQICPLCEKEEMTEDDWRNDSESLSQKDSLICNPRIKHSHLPTPGQFTLYKMYSTEDWDICCMRQTAPKVSRGKAWAGTASNFPAVPREFTSSPWEGRKNEIRSQGYFRKNPSFWKLEKTGSNALVFVLALFEN